MYRRSNYRSQSIRTITAKFAGKCSCCGGAIKAGEIADYYKSQLAHYKAFNGDSSRCYGVLHEVSDYIKRNTDAFDPV